MRTDLNILLDPALNLNFNSTPQTIGYVSTYSRIEGMDILVSLMIIQTIFLIVIFYLLLKRR